MKKKDLEARKVVRGDFGSQSLAQSQATQWGPTICSTPWSVTPDACSLCVSTHLWGLGTYNYIETVLFL